jgi:hypothetical protein
MQQSLRQGTHATVYEVRRDPSLKNKDVIRDKTKRVFPFVSGSKYKGEWINDKKEGFGVQLNPDETKYEGEWAEGKYHGRGTLWVKKGKTYARTYVGDWDQGVRSGQGVFYYPDKAVYRGDWANNRKNGQGRYEHSNGDVYVGEWTDDHEHGFGTLSYANGNVYEGLWSNGKKEGPGIFFYASTKKIYQGEWLEDQPRCGEFRAPTNAEEVRFHRTLPRGLFVNDFELPSLGLAKADEVLDAAVSTVRLSSLNRTGRTAETQSLSITSDQMQEAERVFNSLVLNSSGTIELHNLEEVLVAMGLFINSMDLEQVIEQLIAKEAQYLSFADITEIAAYLQQLQVRSHQVTFGDFVEEEGKRNYYDSRGQTPETGFHK